jgi:hypothetical protein
MKTFYGIQAKYRFKEFNEEQCTVFRKIYATNIEAVSNLSNAIEDMIQRNLDKVNRNETITTIDPVTIKTTVLDFNFEE